MKNGSIDHCFLSLEEFELNSSNPPPCFEQTFASPRIGKAMSAFWLDLFEAGQHAFQMRLWLNGFQCGHYHGR